MCFKKGECIALALTFIKLTMRNNTKYPPREKTPAQLEQLQKAYELGVQAANEGRAIDDYLLEFRNIKADYVRKVDESLLLVEYFTGYRSISQPSSISSKKYPWHKLNGHPTE